VGEGKTLRLRNSFISLFRASRLSVAQTSCLKTFSFLFRKLRYTTEILMQCICAQESATLQFRQKNMAARMGHLVDLKPTSRAWECSCHGRIVTHDVEFCWCAT